MAAHIMDIPNEVLLILFERLGSNDTKKAVNTTILALISVCRRFRQLLLPSVFSDTYSNSKLVKAALGGDSDARGLCGLIRHCWVGDYYSANSDESLVHTLDALDNLSSLTIANLTLDEQVVLAIARRRKLVHLFFSMVQFRPTVAPSTILQLKQLEIETFRLFGQTSAIPPQLLGAFARAVVSPRLKMFQTSYMDLVRSVVQTYADTETEIGLDVIELGDLALDTDNRRTLFTRFVTRATGLTALDFPMQPGLVGHFTRTFADPRVLPKLTKARLLTRWAPLIVPGRPLNHVELRDGPSPAFGTLPDDRTGLIRALKASMGTLRHLFVSLDVLKTCSNELFVGLDGLRELKVDFVTGLDPSVRTSRALFKTSVLGLLEHIPDRILGGLTCLIVYLPSRLLFPEVSFDLGFQHQLVQDLVEKCPSSSPLHQFQLAHDIWWNRSGNRWTLFIPESAYSSIKLEMATPSALQRLVEMEHRVTDYQGAFSTMYMSEGEPNTPLM